MTEQGDGYTLYLGDCLKIMPILPAKSVDAVIADLPYGTTKAKWDVVIPFDRLWVEIKRVIKPGGAVVLFGTQPFTSRLICSNLSWFKYCWTWDKKTGKGHLVARYRPLQQTEDIAVFGKGKINYYPVRKRRPRPEVMKEGSRTELVAGEKRSSSYSMVTDFWHPKTLLEFPWSPTTSLHPTEKPVSLLSYLVKTYTLPDQVVLDCTMGSGSTGEAALSTGRQFVGIELHQAHFDTALARLENTARAMRGLPHLLKGGALDLSGMPLFADLS